MPGKPWKDYAKPWEDYTSEPAPVEEPTSVEGEPAQADWLSPEAAAGRRAELGKSVDDLVRSAAAGFTSKWADEFAAHMSNLTGIGGQAPKGSGFEKQLVAERARDEDIPLSTAIIGEVAGGVAQVAAAPALLPAKVATAGAKLIAPISGWLKAMLGGGAIGGMYGFGAGEGGAEERLDLAADTAGLGALGGGVGYPVVRGIQTGGRAIKEAIGKRRSPAAAAEAKLAERMDLDEMSQTNVETRLRELGPEATIADAAGANVQNLGRDVAGSPGRAANRAKIILEQRAEAEGARIAGAVGKGLDPQDYYVAQEAFLTNMKEKAAPLYRAAYEAHQSITNKALNRLLKSTYGRGAMRMSAKIIEAERASGVSKYMGKIDDELTQAAREAAAVGKMRYPGQPGVIRGLSLEAWDHVKRGFDGLLETKPYRNPDTGKLNQLGRAVDTMRRTLLKELDRATGGETGLYAQARKTYAGEAEALRSLREGRNIFSKDPEIITKELAELSDAGREAYRSGAARKLKDMVDQTPDKASAANRIYGKALNRKRLRALFPDKISYNLFAKALIAERKFTETLATVRGGSQTTPRQAGREDILTGMGATAGAVAGSQSPVGHALIMSRIGRGLGKTLMTPTSKEYTGELSRMLFNKDPRINKQTLDKVFSKLSQKGKQDLVNVLLPIISGQQSGRIMEGLTSE